MYTILYTALRSRLAHQIQKALYTDRNITADRSGEQSITHRGKQLHIEDADENELSLQRNFREQSLPLKQIRQSQCQQIEYVSAVALKYGQASRQSTLKYAETLTEQLKRIEIESTSEANLVKHNLAKRWSDDTLLDQIHLYFNLEVTSPGWIHFRLTPPGLEIWLQSLVHRPLPVAKDTLTIPLGHQFLTKKAASARNSTSVFSILHTYARCHSLLRLGHQLRLIQATQSRSLRWVSEPSHEPSTDSPWQIKTPNPFPWLLPCGAFRGIHPIEWQLVEEICATLDRIAQPDAEPGAEAVLKQADRLSQIWQLFYAQCQIAGEIRQTDPAQAQVRLGLTCITGKLLHYLLRSIGLPTPMFL